MKFVRERDRERGNSLKFNADKEKRKIKFRNEKMRRKCLCVMDMR